MYNGNEGVFILFLGNYGRRPFVYAELKSLARAYFKERLLHACACGYVCVRGCVCVCMAVCVCVCVCVCVQQILLHPSHTSMSSMC